MWAEKHGKVYRIVDRVGGKKVTLKTGFANKAGAQAAITLLGADKLRGEALMPRGGEMTLNDFIDAWWPLYDASLKRTTARTEGSRVRNHIQPLLGHLPLDDLDQMVVLQFVGKLSAGRKGYKPLAPKTVRNVHGILHKILDAAVGARRIRMNPATGTPMPTRQFKEMRFLTAPEIARLLAATPEYWKPLVLLLVSTGLRYGEALGLKVKYVDVLAKTIRIEEIAHMAKGGGVDFTEPKTRAGRRSLVVTTDVAGELAGKVASKERDDLVFLDEKGREAVRYFRAKEWPKIRKAAGLDGLRIHDLRHTHAAVLISAGVPLTAVQRRLGHSSIRVTSDMYGHLLPEVDDKITAAVDSSLALINFGGTVGATAPKQRGATRNDTAVPAGL